MRAGIFAVGIAACLIFAGCGEDKENSVGPQTAREYIDQGWSSFKTADYLAALGSFEAALDRDGSASDAWNGAGWSAGRLSGRLTQAGDNFSRCLALDTTRYDALGGWAFTSYQSGDWDGALSKADALLARRSGWRFLHEPTLDFYDLRLLMAKCYFNKADYSASYQVIVAYLNPAFEADVSSDRGRAGLSREIERLGQLYG